MDAQIAEAAALDAYSRVVVDVAERLSPSVANLRVERRGRRGRIEGGGSAIVLSPDGLLLTCAHVVGAGVGLGLAVPINAATRGVIAALVRDGRVRRAHLGIAGRDGREGVAVADVDPAGPAASAGLRPNDVIVQVAGQAVAGMGDLQRLLGADAIGARLPVLLRRGGAAVELEVVPAELPA